MNKDPGKIVNYFMTLAVLLAAPSAMASICSVEIAQRGSPSDAGSSEISVEWTIPADTLKPYLTPENGRVGGMLPQIPTPQWLEDWWLSPASAAARRMYPRVHRVRELPWKAFPLGLHDKLISHAVRQSALLPEGQQVDFPQADGFFSGDRSLGLERVVLKGKVPLSARMSGNFFGHAASEGQVFSVDLEKLSAPSWFESFTVLRDTNILEPIDTLVDGKISEGTHDLLAIAEARTGAVEHGNASSLQDLLSGIPASSYQIHLRSQPGEMLASQMLNGVNALAAHFGHTRPTLHMHIVEKAPLRQLWEATPQHRVAQALSMVEFVLRANDLEEQRSVIEGNTIRLLRTAKNHVGIWAVLESQHLAKMVDRFMELMFVESYDPKSLHFPYLGDEFKGAFVGVHWSIHQLEKYDRRGVWGLHVRGIDRVSSAETHAAIVDSFQKRMVTGDYVQPFERIWKWLKLPVSLENGINQREIEEIGKKFAMARWNKPWDILFEQADPTLAPLLDSGMREYLKALTEFRAFANGDFEAAPYFEVKLLLHNYASQLNFFDQPAALLKIVQAQQAGLLALREVQLNRSTANPTDIVRTFIRNSGIWERSLEQFELTAGAALQ